MAKQVPSLASVTAISNKRRAHVKLLSWESSEVH